MDRIYMNTIPGDERIHIEITKSDITDLLEDLQPADHHYAVTRHLLDILGAAARTFT